MGVERPQESPGNTPLTGSTVSATVSIPGKTVRDINVILRGLLSVPVGEPIYLTDTDRQALLVVLNFIPTQRRNGITSGNSVKNRVTPVEGTPKLPEGPVRIFIHDEVEAGIEASQSCTTRKGHAMSIERSPGIDRNELRMVDST